MTQLKSSGFTLVEMLVALAIIGLLATVIIGGVAGSREKGRDTRRVSDIEQVQVALRLYAEQNGEYPCEDEDECSATGQTTSANGQIGVGNHIDTLLEPFFPNIPPDPLHDGSDYYYFYDGNVTCAGESRAVVYVKTAETAQYQNGASTGCAGEPGAAEAYTVLLGRSSDTY